jgi:hypothetical protein
MGANVQSSAQSRERLPAPKSHNMYYQFSAQNDKLSHDTLGRLTWRATGRAIGYRVIWAHAISNDTRYVDPSIDELDVES